MTSLLEELIPSDSIPRSLTSKRGLHDVDETTTPGPTSLRPSASADQRSRSGATLSTTKTVERTAAPMAIERRSDLIWSARRLQTSGRHKR